MLLHSPTREAIQARASVRGGSWPWEPCFDRAWPAHERSVFSGHGETPSFSSDTTLVKTELGGPSESTSVVTGAAVRPLLQVPYSSFTHLVHV